VLGFGCSALKPSWSLDMTILSKPLRPRRDGEWDRDKAFSFIVTLAATRSVTLAAAAAGMSRKSAYALKGRDPAFAAAWATALIRPLIDRSPDAGSRTEGGSPVVREGDRRRAAARSTWSTSSPSPRPGPAAEIDSARRDLFFARLARSSLVARAAEA
jgi:hypothetical protein